MADRQTIVVAGAGIGGLTAALALAKAGYDVALCERTEALTEVGAGIQVSPNAGRVLADLGLDDEVTNVAVEPLAIEVRSGVGGDLIVALPAARFRERYGFPYRVIHRADLQSILAGAARRSPHVTLRLGAPVSDVLEQEHGLFVRAGSDVIPAVGLVAADGVWSSLRARIAGASEPKPSGRTAWRAVVPLDNAPPPLPLDRVGLWLAPHAHLVHYPIARGTAVNVVAIVEETWDRPGWSAAGDRKWLLQHFAGWPGAAREIVAAPISWQKWALNAVDPAGPWTRGAMALLGDAAHAMVPFLAQGAAMAIEDAAVLAAHLAGRRNDVPSALRAYEAERKPRATRVAAAAWRTGEAYHAAGLLARIRDAGLRLAGPGLLLRRNDWIYRWRAAAN